MSEDNAEKIDAEKLAADKTEAQQPAAKERGVKVRVLTQCAYGKADDVVVLPKSEAKQATAYGIVDADPAAVAYAEGLKAAD